MPFSTRHQFRSYSMVFFSLMILLLLSNGPAYAEWMPIGEADDEGMTTYVDPDSIRRKGDFVKMWHIFDDKIAKGTINGRSFMSIRVQTEFDCTEERIRKFASSYHSGNMGRGKVVYTDSDSGKWAPVPPGTNAQALWEYACSKK